jgi:hypothetical protein
MLRPARAGLRPDRCRPVASSHATRRPASWACALAVAGMVAATGGAAAQTKPANAPIEFNIPSQPLNAALGRYGDATGREGLYDATLTAGRLSGEVRGAFAPDEALRRLLSGTGLAVEFVDESTFVLLPASAAAGQQANQQARSPEHQRYYGLVQASLLDTFCRSHSVRPGGYRFAAAFWIAPDGVVSRSQRIGSSGDLDADRQIDAALRSVRVGEPPPVGFAQPVLMLIVPQESLVTGCDKAYPALRPVGIGR